MNKDPIEEIVEEGLINLYQQKHSELVKHIQALIKVGESPDTIVKEIEKRTGSTYASNHLWIIANYWYKQYYKPYEGSK